MMGRHVRAILILPFMVTIVIPTTLLFITRGYLYDVGMLSSPWQWVSIVVGGGFILLGITLLYLTIQLFGKIGKGTLAPWDPPEHLVVVGIYQYVRNPMITGVFAILLGEIILFNSIALLAWLAFFITAKLIYITQSEEPELIDRFGEDYVLYRQHVPSWIPHLHPWHSTEQRSMSNVTQPQD